MIELKFNKKLLSADGEMTLDIDMKIARGDLITLYGNSGAGKTTTLRILAGLTEPDSGFIKINNELWLNTSERINLPPRKRSVGFVFQDYALFPNMTVRKNLEYALAKNSKRELIDEILDITELTKLADRKPESLSGGQKQRVALARAIVRKPKILLLDEPLSALDTNMRKKLQDEIYKLHLKFGLTTILVSHSLSEIFKLSKKVYILENGQIIRSGDLSSVFIEKKLSGKYKFEGEILSIKKDDVVYIVTVTIGNNIVKVIATDNEVANLSPGDKVIVSSKAFNPLIMSVK